MYFKPRFYTLKPPCARGFLTFLAATCLTAVLAQSSEIKTRLNSGELSMNFPGIYFRHNSADYAAMPYSVASCFHYIAQHFKHINSFVIWRDSGEAEELTRLRIKKLKSDMAGYFKTRKLIIRSMGDAQKVSGRTIKLGVNQEQVQFLLSLNSVFDVSGVVLPKPKRVKTKRKLVMSHCCIICFFSGDCSWPKLITYKVVGD